MYTRYTSYSFPLVRIEIQARAAKCGVGSLESDSKIKKIDMSQGQSGSDSDTENVDSSKSRA